MLRFFTSIALALFVSCPLLAAAEDSLVHVTGQGSVQVVPDQAEIRFEVVRQGESADALKPGVDETVAKVIEIAEGLGIEARDIQAARLVVHPNFHYNPDTGEQTITSMTVRRSIDLTLRQLESYPELIDAALEAGVNQVGHFQLSLADSSKAQEQAIRAAVDDAMGKARIVADQLDLQVERVRDLRANVMDSRPVPRMAVAAFSSGGAAESFR